MRNWRVLFQLEENSPKATYVQLRDALIEAIRAGRLAPGSALPGTRELARTLCINRKTVVLAYEEAAARGWLLSEARRGTFVHAAIPAPQAAPEPARGRHFAPPFKLAPLPDHLTPYLAVPPSFSGQVLTFDNGTPDHRLLPQAVLQRHYRQAMRTAFKGDWVRYGAGEARLALQAALADMLGSTRGLAVGADAVCVTQGTQMALHIAASAVLRAGDLVLVERLSYPPAWTVLRALGAEIATIDIDQDGCRVDQIEALCLVRAVRLVYLTPHHQFPTTVSMKAERRQKLLALAARHGFTIIEEDYDHEYHYAGRPHLPLASEAGQQHIMYIGSLSKLMAPSFRCGFIVAPPALAQALRRIALLLYGQGDAVMETMLADLLRHGELKRHLRRANRIYQQRRDTLAAALQASLGAGVDFALAQGGLALWCRFDDSIAVDALVERAAGFGLQVRKGRQFSAQDLPENALRLGFGALDHDEIAEAVRRLVRAA